MTSVVIQEGVVRKTQFPRLVIPLSTVLTGAFNLFLNLIIVSSSSSPSGSRPDLDLAALPDRLLVPLRPHGGHSRRSRRSTCASATRRSSGSSSPRVLFYATPILYPVTAFESETTRTSADDQSAGGDLRAGPGLGPRGTADGRWAPSTVAPTAVEAAGGWLGLLPAAAIFVGVCASAAWIFNREAPRIAEAALVDSLFDTRSRMAIRSTPLRPARRPQSESGSGDRHARRGDPAPARPADRARRRTGRRQGAPADDRRTIPSGCAEAGGADPDPGRRLAAPARILRRAAGAAAVSRWPRPASRSSRRSTRRRPSVLWSTIESVLGQTFGDWELCLVDDASPSARGERSCSTRCAARRPADPGRAPGRERRHRRRLEHRPGDGDGRVRRPARPRRPPPPRRAGAGRRGDCGANPEADYVYTDEDKMTAKGHHSRAVPEARLVAGADAHADVHLPPQRAAPLAGRGGRRLRPRVRGGPGLGPRAEGDRAGASRRSTCRESSTTGAGSRPRPRGGGERGEAVGLRGRRAGDAGALRADRVQARSRATRATRASIT